MNTKMFFKGQEIIGTGSFKLNTSNAEVFEKDGFIYHVGDFVIIESPEYSGRAQFVGYEYGNPKFIAVSEE